MNNLKNYRRFLFSALGSLSLIASLGTASPVMAAPIMNDISVTIVADRDTIRPGQNVTYTVTMTNLGPDDATFVDVDFQFSNELVLVSMECDRGISPDTPFCEYSTLESGGTVVSTLVATPHRGVPRPQRIVTTSAVVFFETADGTDPNMGNNTASVQTRLGGRSSHP